jgi:tRNA A-37 threonylcarbamoyl transferase component Bud32
MAQGFQGRVLKSGLARTVYVNRRGAVVKRFHNPSAVQALRDRRRARAEERVLGALLALDLPVPRPLEVRRVSGAWEVVMERIQGAVQLGAVLSGEEPAPAAPDEIAARVGRLLARAHAAGLDHPDLHPGNILLDDAGQPWLVDFHNARLRARIGCDLAERDLVALLSALRETLAAGSRLRLVQAWVEAGGAVPSQDAADIEAFAARLEDRARLHRRAQVAHGQGRWTRESSVCQVLQRRDGPLYLRRGTDPALAEELERSAGSGPAVVEAGGARYRVLAGLAPGELKDRWYHAARLSEHGLAVLSPVAWSPAMAAFALPAEAVAIPAEELSPALAGALLGALHDRGLELPSLGPIVWAAPDAAWLEPPARLRHVDARAGRIPVERRFAAAPHLDVRAYLGAQRGHRREGLALVAELAGRAST